MKKILTLIRKETTEHRGSALWLPVAIAAVLIGVVMMSLIWQHDATIDIQGQSPASFLAEIETKDRTKIANAVMIGLSLPFFVPMVLVVIFYLAHALFDERKDRSILFWKSLPISDQLTVGSKLLMAIVVIPVIYWAALVMTSLVIFSMLSIFGLSLEINMWSLFWTPTLIANHAFLALSAALMHGLWILPIYAWLLFCSAWAPRSPLLMAIAVTAVISLALGLWQWMTSGQWMSAEPLRWIAERLAESPLQRSALIILDDTPTVQVDSSSWLELMQQLGSPALWWGVLLAAPLLVGATYLRRRATA